MDRCDSAFPKWIDSLLLDELAAAKWVKLRVHLKGCAACRDRYNRVALAERMLHGGPAALAAPSPESFARVGAALFEVEEERSPGRGRFLIPRWIYGVFAIGAAAALLPFVVQPHHEVGARVSGQSEFAARGTATVAAERAGLRAFCLDGSANGGIRSLDPGPTPPQCATTDLLKFTYSNQAGYEDVFLFGVDAGWAIKWYEPRPPATLSVPATRAIDQPLGGAIKIGVNHDPGLVRVFALFGHAPISGREVEDAVAALRLRGISPRDATELPLAGRGDLLQRSLLIEVTRARP